MERLCSFANPRTEGELSGRTSSHRHLLHCCLRDDLQRDKRPAGIRWLAAPCASLFFRCCWPWNKNVDLTKPVSLLACRGGLLFPQDGPLQGMEKGLLCFQHSVGATCGRHLQEGEGGQHDNSYTKAAVQQVAAILQRAEGVHKGRAAEREVPWHINAQWLIHALIIPIVPCTTVSQFGVPVCGSAGC